MNKEIDLDLTRRNEIPTPPAATAIDYRTGAALVPDGVQYDRMMVPMLVIMQDHDAQLNSLKTLVTALQAKTAHLP